jgi:hypothetical protein
MFAEAFRGMVLHREVLFRVAKLGPVKHCVVKFAKALCGIVRCVTEGSCLARLRAAGQALVSSRSGVVRCCEMLHGKVNSWGEVMYGNVRR